MGVARQGRKPIASPTWAKYALGLTSQARTIENPKTSSYRWIILAAGFASLFIFGGFFGSSGLFLKPLAREFGWSRAAISGAISVCVLVQGLVGIATGNLSDRYGPRRVMAIGMVIGGLGIMLVPLTSNLIHLYIFYGLITGTGTSVIWSPIVSTISRWFQEKRGLALGITTSGTGFGIMVMPLVASYLITSLGWRWSFVVLGLLFLALTIPAALLLRPAPSPIGPLSTLTSVGEVNEQETKQEPVFSWRGAIATLPFWLLAATQLFNSIPQQFVTVHIAPAATDKGIEPGAAASIITLMGIGNIVGRLAIGHLSDQIGSRGTLVLSFLIQAVTLFLLMPAANLASFYAIAFVYSMTASTVMPTNVKLAAEFFGLRSSGMIIGLWFAAACIGGAIGPFFAGFVFDVTGSYSVAYLTGGILVIAAGCLSYAARAPRRAPVEIKARYY